LWLVAGTFIYLFFHQSSEKKINWWFLPIFAICYASLRFGAVRLNIPDLAHISIILLLAAFALSVITKTRKIHSAVIVAIIFLLNVIVMHISLFLVGLFIINPESPMELAINAVASIGVQAVLNAGICLFFFFKKKYVAGFKSLGSSVLLLLWLVISVGSGFALFTFDFSDTFFAILIIPIFGAVAGFIGFWIAVAHYSKNYITIQDMKAENQSLTIEIENLTAKIKQLGVDKEKLMVKIKGLNEQSQQFAAEKERLMMEIGRIEGEANSLKAEVEKLIAEKEAKMSVKGKVLIGIFDSIGIWDYVGGKHLHKSVMYFLKNTKAGDRITFIDSFPTIQKSITKGNKVRSIRTAMTEAIENTWDAEKNDKFHEIAKYYRGKNHPTKGCPTPKQFVTFFVNEFNNEINSEDYEFNVTEG